MTPIEWRVLLLCWRCQYDCQRQLDLRFAIKTVSNDYDIAVKPNTKDIFAWCGSIPGNNFEKFRLRERMLRASLARVKKNFLSTIHRISCLESGIQMNSMHSVPTVGSGHVGNSCFRHFKTQGTGFLRHTGTPGYGIFGKVSFLKNEASTSPGFRKVITESQFLSSTRLYNSLGRTGRALASGGGSGNGNSNGGSGDGDNNDDSSSSGGWFGPFWAMYLAQLDKNPVC